MLKNYLLIAFRSIRHNPGNAAINTVGLAVGMAGFILIMLFVQDQLAYDGFHEKAERIHRINKRVSYEGVDPEDHAITSGLVGPTLEAELPEVEESARVLPWFDPVPLAVDETVLKVEDVVFADASFFEMFSFRLLSGNPATALVQPQSIVVSRTLAERLFAGEDPVGRTVVGLNDHTYTVTGVIEDTPHNSHLRYQALISWSSTVPGEGALQFDWANRWLTSSMYTFVLLRQGSDPDAFADKLPGFLERNYPDGAEKYSLYPQPLTDIHLGSAHLRYQRGVDLTDKTFVHVFGLSAILILLIACINFVNTSTALADDRAREVGVRKALGAGRLQLRKQFLGESILLAGIAFLLSACIVEWALPGVESLIGKQLPVGFVGNLEALAVTLPGVVIVGILAGFYPAVVLSRFRPVSVLRGSTGDFTGGAGLRRLLVALQFAISTVLLGGSVIVLQQTEFMRSRDLGIDQDQVVIVPLSDTRIREHFEAFRASVLDHPGVIQATGSDWVPGEPEQTYSIRPEGRPERENWVVQVLQLADFDFMETYGIELASGRFFDERFAGDSNRAVVINEALARGLGWGSEEAVGKRLDVPGDIDEGYVIGVVKDFHLRSLQHPIEPVVFISQARFDNLSVRLSPENTASVVDHLEATWKEFEPRYPFRYRFVDETFGEMYAGEQRLARVLSIFSGLAVFVACLGLFGLAALMARRRTKEIGIRKTLGATVSGILTLLTAELVRLLAAATLVAIPVAYLLSQRWLSDFAYRMELSVIPFMVVALSLIAIGVIAVSYQSVRAAVANPVEALRYE